MRDAGCRMTDGGRQTSNKNFTTYLYVQTNLYYLCGTMIKPSSPYCQCLYYASNALARITTRMAEEEFASVGLSPSYAFLIMTVAKKPGIQPGEISKELELTPSTITRLIEKMEKKGLLRRKFEGKTTGVFITAKGEALTIDIKKCWLNLYLRFKETLGEEQAEKLTGVIYTAVKELNK